MKEKGYYKIVNNHSFFNQAKNILGNGLYLITNCNFEGLIQGIEIQSNKNGLSFFQLKSDFELIKLKDFEGIYYIVKVNSLRDFDFSTENFFLRKEFTLLKQNGIDFVITNDTYEEDELKFLTSSKKLYNLLAPDVSNKTNL